MSLSTLPLGYCTNVHAGLTVKDVLAGLDRFTVPVMKQVGRPVAAGLWLARPVVDELLADPSGLAKFADELAARKLACYTLNAFPYGDFHAARVKENVYLPDWSQPERLTYTAECATALAAFLPEGTDGSISTLPLGFKGFDHPADFDDACIRNLISCAEWFDRVKRDTGRTVRLAIEPEPFCRLETTPEAIAFFKKLWRQSGAKERIVREHIGLCYDVCHQAVEFESISESVASLDAAGVRINKVQISCAVQLDDPAKNAAGRDALRHFVEPRYLHQTFSRPAVDRKPSSPRSPSRLAAATGLARSCIGTSRQGASPIRIHRRRRHHRCHAALAATARGAHGARSAGMADRWPRQPLVVHRQAARTATIFAGSHSSRIGS